MKAISLWQPWASAIVLGVKSIETRSWTTRYRGPLLIHATKTMPKAAQDFAAIERALGRLPDRVPLGALVGIAELYDVQPTEELELCISAIERMYGDYSWGRFGWLLKDVRAFEEPIPYRGAQGLFEVPDHAIKEAIYASGVKS